MNHTTLSSLLAHMTENPKDLTDRELDRYIWEVEQLHKELQLAVIARQEAATHTSSLNTPGSRPREYGR